MFNAFFKLLIFFAICTLVTACSGMFDTDNTPKPTALKSIKTEIAPVQLWSNSVGQQGDHWLRQTPAFYNNKLYTVSDHGDIYAIDAATGRQVWRRNLTGPFAAGPAVHDNTVIVVNRAGRVYALDANTAKIKWEQRVNNEVLASPAVNDRLVVIKTSNGQLYSFLKESGAASWTYHQAEPNLILHSASTPRFHDNRLYAGFASGNLVKLDAYSGGTVWSKPVAVPEGAFAIERMIDIDADPTLAGHRVYAASFQGKVVAFMADSGQTLWSHNLSSYTGMATDDNGLYVTDAQGELWAFDAFTGTVRYRQADLLARGLSAPALLGNYVIVGDRQGFVHLFNKQDGRIVARLGLGTAILATPIVSHDRFYILTQNGRLSAFRLR
jgi:outer membrane protein assembly factor BamB